MCCCGSPMTLRAFHLVSRRPLSMLGAQRQARLRRDAVELI
jgi:hypothetical protein